MTYLVDGLAPMALRASRYWRVIVFSSMPRAAVKIRSSAWLKPSARRMAAWRSPSAWRIADCFWPSATLIADWRGALGLGDDGAPGALRGQLPVHRVLDVARRRDLADLDRRDLAAPALGDLVELGPQDLVDLLALGQHVVEQDVADDRAQGRRRHALERPGEVRHVDDALERLAIRQ